MTAEEVTALHRQVRVKLATLDTDGTVQDVIGALMYEVVSLVAEAARTKAEGFEAIAGMCAVALEQIDTYGVGKPHP